MQARVEVLRDVTDELVEAFGRLLPQLSASAAPLGRDDVARIVDCPTNTLLAARADGRLVGMLTLVLIPIPTGLRARIEDVVVDASARRYGVATALTNEAVRLAREAGARDLDLTSRPSRVGANALYDKLGFERRESNVYRLTLID